jgi:hypothetical protein
MTAPFPTTCRSIGSLDEPIERMVRRVDAAQQGFGPASLIFGVMKKFGDDNAGTLVTGFAFSTFVCLFPLLLVLITVLNLVLAHDPGARRRYSTGLSASSRLSATSWATTFKGFSAAR